MLHGCRSLDALTVSEIARHGLETVSKFREDSLRLLQAIEEIPSPGEPGWLATRGLYGSTGFANSRPMWPRPCPHVRGIFENNAGLFSGLVGII